MTHSHLKSVSIANEVVLLGAIVVPENLFVQIAEQVEWFHVDVGSLESALEQAPEVFESVGVDLPINVTLRMVHNRVPIPVVVESVIRGKVIRVDRAPRFDVSADFRLQFMPLSSMKRFSANLAAALKDSNDSRFTFGSASQNNFGSLIRVHKASSTTDERLIYFHFSTWTADLHCFFFMESETNAVHHKPSRLLSDSQSAANLVGANAVLGVHDEPNGNHPLVHAERGILEDGSDLDRELLLTVLAEPNAPRRDKRVLRSIAAWASNLAIWPAQFYSIVKRALRVREESNCFLQRLGKLECCAHG